MHWVHGAAVHTGIPIGSNTNGQNTLFPMASQLKSHYQSFLWLLYGGMHGKASHFYATVVQCYIDLVPSQVMFWQGGHLLSPFLQAKP